MAGKKLSLHQRAINAVKRGTGVRFSPKEAQQLLAAFEAEQRIAEASSDTPTPQADRAA